MVNYSHYSHCSPAASAEKIRNEMITVILALTSNHLTLALFKLFNRERNSQDRPGLDDNDNENIDKIKQNIDELEQQ